VPFGEEEVLPMKVYAEILKGKINFHDGISHKARDVITSLLEPQPSHRAKGSLCKLKKFPWLEGIHWVRNNQDLLLNRKAKAPIQPARKDSKQLISKAMAKGETVMRALSVFSI
jgi:hypothetical protein